MSFETDLTIKNTNDSKVIADSCPDWASPLIQKILVLEVELGTIKNPAIKSDDPNWSTASVDSLTRIAGKMDREHLDNIEEEVQILFAKISRGLLSEGHSAAQIAGFINSRIPTGCRLPYCNADEVISAAQA